MKPIILNDLGEGLSEAKLIEWKVAVGDDIQHDQIIALLETAKAIIELPSPFKGHVTALNHQPGDTIPVGSTIATIAHNHHQASTNTMAPLVGKSHHETTLLANEGHLRHTPTTSLPLSSQDDRIQSMAHRMAKSNEVIAATLFDDMSVVDFNPNSNITAQCIYKLIEALTQFPQFNAHFSAQQMKLTPQPQIDLGIAFNDNNQLKVPVVEHIEQYDLAEISQIIQSIKDQGMKSPYVSSKNIKPSFTLTNVGGLGGRYGTPILLPPAVGILAIGRICDTPVVRNKRISIEPIAPLSLTFDHRALTGAEACQFLTKLCHSPMITS